MITTELPVGTKVYGLEFGGVDEPWVVDHFYGVSAWLVQGIVSYKIRPTKVHPYRDGYKIERSNT